LSTALFLLGYALAIPITLKMSVVVERQNRLALVGHQAGIMIATLGWILRGAIFVAVGHVLWLFIAYAWFTNFGPGRRSVSETVTTQRRRWSRRGGSTG
jgi:hypothetical protein